VRELCKKSEFIDDLNGNWVEQNVKDKIKLKYVVGGMDNIVDSRSAKGFWGNRDTETLIDEDHFSIIAPDSIEHLSYTIFRKILFVA
jgi:hypothetical protein